MHKQQKGIPEGPYYVFLDDMILISKSQATHEMLVINGCEVFVPIKEKKRKWN